MATVFMRWLETSPESYDRGIQILTLGRLRRVQERIAHDYIGEGTRVLDLGCGTGRLTALMARQGAVVTGIDASPQMLAEAHKRMATENLEGRVLLRQMDATMIGECFAPASFDLIVSTLVFSELSPDERPYVLRACAKLLAPNGRLLIADEVIPSRLLPRAIFYLVRWPLLLLTWLLTHTSTGILRDLGATLSETGLCAHTVGSYLGGSLALFEIMPGREAELEADRPPAIVGHLRHQITLRSLLIDLWSLFFRIIPPYPKMHPGLYAVGHPDHDSPVLVTGNFDLTVRRLVAAIDGQANAWLLVADSAGINVWCAAGGGYFTAEKVIASVKFSHLEKVVNHRSLILPQLCANGVDGWRVRQETGWHVRWGPVRAMDIPAYLAAGRRKTDAMRRIRFALKDRLEMLTVVLGFYGLLILVPLFLLRRSLLGPVAASMVPLSYLYAIIHPWLPGRDGLVKSIPLTLIVLAGLLVYTVFWNPLPKLQLFHWIIGLTGLSVFTAAELQGMSPLMRGEQANWRWEAIIGATLGLVYWLVPLILGWS